MPPGDWERCGSQKEPRPPEVYTSRAASFGIALEAIRK